MPVESAADRAAFFNTEEFAEAALFTGPGAIEAVPCIVIVDRGQGREKMEAGGGNVAGVDRLVQVLAEGAIDGGLTPTRRGLFTLVDPLTGTLERVEVVAEPMLDHTGAWWTVEVVQVGG